MKRLSITSALVLICAYAYGCSCRQSTSSYFLKQVKDFHAIVEGKFYRDGNSGQGFLIIDQIYKGAIPKDTIQLGEGGLDCTEVFMEDSGRTLVLGLHKSQYESGPSNTYSALSCVTSVLVLNKNKVDSKTKFYNLHIRRPRISLFSTEMRKDKFVRKIKQRL